MIEIGLTGGIGSGKSTVADALVARGAILIDADRIVRELQEPGRPVFAAMVERWGEQIIGADGRLDRAAVAAIVFNDPDELESLNAIVHPAVLEQIATRRETLSSGDSVVVLDIPLLARGDGRPIRDEYRAMAGIVVVDVDPELAVHRLVTQRGFSEVDARARVSSQAGRKDRVALADFVIDNSGDRAALEAQIDRCWEWITSLPGTGASARSG